MKISLIGFMGSGKTSTAAQLATRLSLPQLEMDDTILERTGCTDMKSLFSKGGEILLREQEITLAHELATKEDIIISTGGGVVMNKIIIDYLKQKTGIVIYLKVSFEAIRNRLHSDTSPRPLFENLDEAQQLYSLREPLYEAYADYIVDCDGKVIADITQEIVSYIKSREQNLSENTDMPDSR